jgi:hypothetical protein
LISAGNGGAVAEDVLERLATRLPDGVLGTERDQHRTASFNLDRFVIEG